MHAHDDVAWISGGKVADDPIACVACPATGRGIGAEEGDIAVQSVGQHHPARGNRARVLIADVVIECGASLDRVGIICLGDPEIGLRFHVCGLDDGNGRGLGAIEGGLVGQHCPYWQEARDSDQNGYSHRGPHLYSSNVPLVVLDIGIRPCPVERDVGIVGLNEGDSSRVFIAGVRDGDGVD